MADHVLTLYTRRDHDILQWYTCTSFTPDYLACNRNRISEGIQFHCEEHCKINRHVDIHRDDIKITYKPRPKPSIRTTRTIEFPINLAPFSVQPKIVRLNLYY